MFSIAVNWVARAVYDVPYPRQRCRPRIDIKQVSNPNINSDTFEPVIVSPYNRANFFFLGHEMAAHVTANEAGRTRDKVHIVVHSSESSRILFDEPLHRSARDFTYTELSVFRPRLSSQGPRT